MKDNSSVLLYYCTTNVLDEKLYNLHKKEPITVEILNILSAQLKVLKILVVFETTNQCFFKFYMTFHCHET